MFRRTLALLALLLASTAAESHAGILTTTGLATTQQIWATSTILGASFTHDRISASPFKASYDGSTSLNLYCVNLKNDIDPTDTYQATVRTDGVIHGSAVPNAGKVAWLLTTYAAVADTADERNALQAAIWRAEYGNAFQLDGADNGYWGNSSSVINLYKGYLAALGSNTAGLGSVSWYSPVNDDRHHTDAQGLAGVNPAAVPEPASLAMCGMASLAGVGAWARRRKAATA